MISTMLTITSTTLKAEDVVVDDKLIHGGFNILSSVGLQGLYLCMIQPVTHRISPPHLISWIEMFTKTSLNEIETVPSKCRIEYFGLEN